MDFPQLIGPGYTLFSAKADCQSSKNLYLERIESGAGRNPFVMYRSPGLRVFSTDFAPTKLTCRGFLELNDHLFDVQDDTVNDLLDGGIVNSSLGPIANDGGLVSMDASINSLFIVSVGVLYRINSGTLTEPVTPFTPAAVAVLAGYVFCLAEGTNQIFFSVDDGATWNALDYQTAEASPNTLVNIIVDHQEMWALGNRRTQVFVISGDPDAPLQPVSSGLIEMGLASRFAIGRMDNSLFWFGRNANGDHIVSRAEGYNPQTVSNRAVENTWRSYADHSNASMATYQLNGHTCLRLTFPAANKGLGATWEYDASTKAWGEVGWWNKRYGRYERHRGNCIVSAFGKILVGDYANGFIYEMTPDEYTDFGYPLRWERRAPHITKDGKRIKYTRNDLFLQVGVGLSVPLWLNDWSQDPVTFAANLATAVSGGDVTADQAVTLQRIYNLTPYVPLNPYPTPDVMHDLGFYPWGAQSTLSDGTTIGDPPQLAMRFSNNGAETFNAYRYRSMGTTGSFEQRLYWGGIGGLGMGRDRVWEYSGEAPVKTAIVQGTFDGEVLPF